MSAATCGALERYERLVPDIASLIRATLARKGDDMARRTGDSRFEAEKAFKSATTKPLEQPAPAAPSLPGAKEMVSLRIDRDVLDFFQADGPGWQERVNAALRKAAGK